jgi:hypothetical protein
LRHHSVPGRFDGQSSPAEICSDVAARVDSRSTLMVRSAAPSIHSRRLAQLPEAPRVSNHEGGPDLGGGSASVTRGGLMSPEFEHHGRSVMSARLAIAAGPCAAQTVMCQNRTSAGQAPNLAAKRVVRLRTNRDTCRGGFETRPGATNTDREVKHLSYHAGGVCRERAGLKPAPTGLPICALPARHFTSSAAMSTSR